MKSWKKYLAEFLGTMILVVFACGIAMFSHNKSNDAESFIIIALGFGLTLMACIYTIGDISGCHINPAVSIAMLVDGRMGFVEFVGYIISQFLGGIAGAAILMGFAGGEKTAVLGANALNQSLAVGDATVAVSPVLGLIVEIVLTCLFVYTVLCVSKKENFKGAGLVIGLALAVVHMLGLPFTGTSVNPARTFGPNLFSSMLTGKGTYISQVWIFIVGPLVGGILAALIYRLLNKPLEEE